MDETTHLYRHQLRNDPQPPYDPETGRRYAQCGYEDIEDPEREWPKFVWKRPEATCRVCVPWVHSIVGIRGPAGVAVRVAKCGFEETPGTVAWFAVSASSITCPECLEVMAEEEQTGNVAV